MTTTTLTKTARTLLSSQTLTAGSTVRAVLDLRTAHGGWLTMKITNGGTGPTAQCEGRVLTAANDGATPTAAAEGTDWKLAWKFGGGTTANEGTPRTYTVEAGVQHLEVEFTGNTGQSVTIEAYFSEITNAVSA